MKEVQEGAHLVQSKVQGRTQRAKERNSSLTCLALGRCKGQLSWELQNPTKQEEEDEESGVGGEV